MDEKEKEEFARRRLDTMLQGMSNEKVEGVMDFIGFWASMRNLGDKYVRELALEMVIIESYRRNMTNGNETHD